MQIKVETARLTIVSVDDVEKNILSANRIAGYPIAGELSTLAVGDGVDLARIVLDSGNYFEMWKRCANQSMVGIRFSKGDDVVEFALGVPCQLALWAYRENRGTRLWGEYFSVKATEKLTAILEK